MGTEGTALAESSLDSSTGVTILLFTKGAALVTLEFRWPTAVACTAGLRH
ncbi:hypothetical protein [Mycobacterium uberis]|nr:hypothetical protein [Mycobacterium uberis]